MKVMHYYTYKDTAGGPLTYLENIVKSEYLSEIEFKECYQQKALSALRPNDFKRIVNEIKAFSPDVLHIHGLQGEGFIGLMAAKKAKVKSLMAVHGIQIDAQDIGKVKKLLFGKIIEPYTLKKSSAVYCVCQKTEKRDIIQKNAKNLLPALHNFVPDSFLQYDDVNADLPDHNGKTVVCYVGRVTKEKGMAEFAHCVLNDGRDDAQYWVVGDGEYLEEMKQTLRAQAEKGKVYFFGQQSDVRPFYKNADVFLFPSYHENLSLSILEASILKCCPIVTSVGGNTEIIEDGVSGMVIPPKDPDSLLNALQIVLNDKALCEKYADAAYDRVNKAFSEKVITKRLYDIYLNLTMG